MDSSVQLMMQAEDIYIEVELPERDDKVFARKYVEATCHSAPKVGEAGLSRQNTAGHLARIYFNASEKVVNQLNMFELGVEIATASKRPYPRSDHSLTYRYRIDSNAFFWKLARNGFLLGRWTKASGVVQVNEPKVTHGGCI